MNWICFERMSAEMNQLLYAGASSELAYDYLIVRVRKNRISYVLFAVLMISEFAELRYRSFSIVLGLETYTKIVHANRNKTKTGHGRKGTNADVRFIDFTGPKNNFSKRVKMPKIKALRQSAKINKKC